MFTTCRTFTWGLSLQASQWILPRCTHFSGPTVGRRQFPAVWGPCASAGIVTLPAARVGGPGGFWASTQFLHPTGDRASQPGCGQGQVSHCQLTLSNPPALPEALSTFDTTARVKRVGQPSIVLPVP